VETLGNEWGKLSAQARTVGGRSRVLHLAGIHGFQMQRQARGGSFCSANFQVGCLAGFPTRRRRAKLARPAHARSADWEIGETAGWETQCH